MKKGYYIHFQGRTSIGVSKKIDMQMEEFRKYYDMREIEIKTSERSLLQRIIGLFPFCSIKRNYEEALMEICDPTFLYIRRTVADRDYVNFMRCVKNKYPDCKIIVEIFTYPYDKDEFMKWDSWPFYFKELLWRPHFREVIDRFVIYTEDKEIFGIPTIQTINGINVRRERVVQCRDNGNDDIHLIAVAFMQRQHGYEWVIKGLRTYYSKPKDKKVYLYLVGDGPEKRKYVKLIHRYHLEKYVEIYATLDGMELERIYDKADIALVTFGTYKLKINRTSALKTREYMAKGLPMATGCPIDVFEKRKVPYVCNVENKGKEIDIMKLIQFYLSLLEKEKGKANLISDIRAFAEKNVDIGITMAPIIAYIQK